MMKLQKGVTLIELAIFIIVLGIIGSGLLMSFDVSLQKSPNINKSSRAAELAQQRMDIILGKRKMDGFETIPTNDSNYPCSGGSPPGYCTIPSGYAVETYIGDDSTPGSSWVTPNYKIIDVTVTDSTTNKQLAKTKALISAYS